jgi:hypothetical protein
VSLSKTKHQRLKRHSKSKQKKIIIFGLLLILLFLCILFLIAYLNFVHAAREVEIAKADFDKLINAPSLLESSGGRKQASIILQQARANSIKADHTVQNSIAISLLDNLPIIADQIANMKAFIHNIDNSTVLANRLLDAIDEFTANERLSNDQIPIAPIEQLQSRMSKLSHSLPALILSDNSIISSVKFQESKFDSYISRLQQDINEVDSSLGVLINMLGTFQNQKYLIVGENNDEMRDQGMILSYDTASFYKGHIFMGDPQFIGNLNINNPVDVPIPAGTQEAFGNLNPELLWQSVNATANFPWSAEAMSQMYHRATGLNIDGIIALDVPAMADILNVIGGINVPGISTQINSSNISQILMYQIYASNPNNQNPRKDILALVAKEIIQKLTTASNVDLIRLGKALANAAAGNHLIIWSADSANEQEILRLNLGGYPAELNPSRVFRVDLQNATATKLDYFIRITLQISVDITKLNNAIIVTKVIIFNGAPKSSEATYQLGPDDINSFSPGQYVGRLYFWGPKGSEQPSSIPESGLQLSAANVNLLPGQTYTHTFTNVIYHASTSHVFELLYSPQPRLFPDKLNVTIRSSHFKSFSANLLNKNLELSWQLPQN